MTQAFEWCQILVTIGFTWQLFEKLWSTGSWRVVMNSAVLTISANVVVSDASASSHIVRRHDAICAPAAVPNMLRYPGARYEAI